MAKFFRKVRKQLLEKDQFGSYLKYAVGEIALVTIGILIAVAINSWSEEQKQERRVNDIMALLASDMVNDTLEVKRIIDFYQKREASFLDIMNDSISPQALSDCRYCYLITNYRLLELEKKGYNRLKEYSDVSESSGDSLAMEITYFYSELISRSSRIEGYITEDVTHNLTHWRDGHPWYADVVQRKPNERYLAYIENSPEYRNKVAHHYTLVYRNYINLLKNFLFRSRDFLPRIEARLAED